MQEIKMIKDQVNAIIYDHKLANPVTRKSVLQICKHMNLRVTELQAIEAVLHCRGQLMEASPEEDYNFDKLVRFFH